MKYQPNQIEIATKIAAALNGHHTEQGPYGHSLLTTKIWEKNGKTRIYLDRRHVDSDGTINNRLQGNGYIEILAGGEIIYATRLEGHEIRRIVEGLC